MKFKPINWFSENRGRKIFVSGFKLMNDKLSKHNLIVTDNSYNVILEVSENIFSEDHLEKFLHFIHKRFKEDGKTLIVLSSELRVKKSFYGFEDLFCYVLKVPDKWCVSTFRKIEPTCVRSNMEFKIHETDVNELVEFIIDKKTTFCDWLDVPERVCIKSKEIFKSEDNPQIEVFPVIMFFDLECETLDTEIIQCSVVIVAENKIRTIHMISVYKLEKFTVDDIPVRVYVAANERHLISLFLSIIELEDPDIISGYNILGFDWNKILKVCATDVNLHHAIVNNTAKKEIGFCTKSIIREIEFETAQIGKKYISVLDMPGRCNIDVFSVVSREFKFTSNKLNEVAKEVLNDEKKNVSYIEIKQCSIFIRLTAKIVKIDDIKNICQQYLTPYKSFPLVRELNDRIMTENNMDGINSAKSNAATKIAKYCVQDSVLTWKLFDKLNVFHRCREMSMCTYSSPSDIYTRGQQNRVFCLLQKMKSEDVVFSQPCGEYKARNTAEVPGALVITPEIGVHNHVACLDFASLYPTIIIEMNLCPTTYLKEPTDTARIIKTTSGEFYFEHESVREGLLPRLCKELISERKKCKNKLKVEQDPFLKTLLDCKQNALKVTTNSIYGFTAARKGKRPFIPVAICVTSIGRTLISFVKQIAEENQFIVVYGDTDSVFVKALDEFSVEMFVNLARKLSNAVRDYKRILTGIEEKESNFTLEFENAYEVILLKTKKNYFGKTTDGKIIKKGVLTVRKDYCTQQKKIYENFINGVVNQIDKHSLIENLETKVKELILCREHHEFVISSSHKELSSYAQHFIKSTVFEDKDHNSFVTDKAYDERFVFKGVLPNCRAVIQKAKRGQDVSRETVIDYVFCSPSKITSSSKKGDFAEEFDYFLRMKPWMKICRFLYLDKLVTPVDELFNVLKIFYNPIDVEAEVIRKYGTPDKRCRIKKNNDCSCLFHICEANILDDSARKYISEYLIDRRSKIFDRNHVMSVVDPELIKKYGTPETKCKNDEDCSCLYHICKSNEHDVLARDYISKFWYERRLKMYNQRPLTTSSITTRVITPHLNYAKVIQQINDLSAPTKLSVL